ncbi:PAS domain S-box protein [Anabaena sphaerica FACHB-251]|uniref:Circadian input-output histidine kinase CikA n=1 Tax=Anabaena sphaerica FACHB-251 TaxID=2692883 RepID=A0A926WK26_9NOST|nr:PAS domain S-box protein [Anabaena sphaerica]MBD2296041.1 PAS domain S-box protein [Anabaena sphaerica FACHB-251]
MAISHYSILILEDSPEDRVLYCRYLNQDKIATYDFIEVETGLEALQKLGQTSPDLILINYQLSDMNGLEFLKKLKFQFSSLEIPVIMLAGQGNESIAVQAMKSGCQDYIVKSKITRAGLCRAVHTALEKTHLNQRIRIQNQQQQLLAGISLRIRQFFRLEEILSTSVQEVREFLKADRVIVYQFDHQMNGKIVAESVLPQWKALLNSQVKDTCYQEIQEIADLNGTIRAMPDIYNAGLTACHIDVLERFQVKANLVVPILLNKEAREQKKQGKQGKQKKKDTSWESNLVSSHFVSKFSSQVLWGLIFVHQCSRTREWETTELGLLQQLSVQMALAIQQAELYENLQNLNTALEQKVEERTKELQASERRFRAIFNNTFQFTGLLTTEGILLEANQTALNFGGIQLEEVINRPFWEAHWWTISPETQDNLRQAIARAAQGEFIRYEVDVLGGGGEIVTIDFSIRPLKDESEQVLMLITEGRDISDKKRIERERQEALKALKASEAELRGLFNAMVDVILVTDRQGRYLKIAPTNADKLYRPAEDLLGKTVHEVLPNHIADRFMGVIQETLATQQPSQCEYSLQIGKKEVWFSAKVSPISQETVIWAARDITEAKHNEIIHEQAEKALQENQILLKLIMDSLPMAIFWKDRNSRYLGCNRQLLLDAGLSSYTEIIGKTDFDMVWRDQAPLYQAGDRIVIETGQSQFNIEEPFTKTGNINRWLRTNKIPLHNPEGEIFGVLVSYEDITERKQMEQALQENQILLQVVMDSLPMAIFWKDRNSRFLGCNRQLLLDAGLSSYTEIIGKTDFDMPWRDQAPLYQAGDRIVIESGQANFNIEEALIKSDNRTIWLRTNKIPLHNPEGEIFGVLASYEDITERKEMEQALQESQRRYATLATSAPVGIYRTDAVGNCLYVNNRWCENSGLTPQEAAGCGWKRALHPEDRDLVETQWDHFVQTGEKFSLEYRFVRPDGVETWVFGQAVPEIDPEGNVTGYVGTITDISSRKKAEEALRRSEKLYRTLVDNFPNGAVVLFDHDLRYLLVGGLGLASVGLNKAEMEGKTIWEIFPAEVCEIIAPVAVQALAGESVTSEVPYGDRVYVTHHIPVPDEQGNVIAGMVMTQDFTDRKKAEQERDRLLQILESQNQTLEAQVTERTSELQQSKERFRTLVETSSDWVWEVNEFGAYTYASPQIINLLGYSPEEVFGKTPFDLMPPAEAERVLNEFMKFVSVQAPFQCLENTNRHKDGRLITLETSAVPIFDKDRQFRGYRGIDRDITARKLSEAALRQNEARFQRIAANIPGVMYQYILHPDGSYKFVYMSDRCRELFELEPATIQEDANAIFDLIHPEDFPSLPESIAHSAHSLQQWSWEGRFMTPSGRLKWMQGISQPQQQANGDILWDGLILDISERKQIEIALHNLSDRLDLAIKSGQIGIWDWDIINNHLVWDDRMYELYGVKASDFPGAYQVWEAGLHPDDLLSGRTAIQEAIAGTKDFEPEFRVVCPDGTIKFIKAYAIVQRNSQGKAQRMIGINFDITERKQSEAKLQAAEVQLRSLSDRLKLAVKSAKIGIWDLDLVNDSLVWDERMYQLFGISPMSFDPSQGAWAKFEGFVHPDDIVTVRETVQQVIAEDKELDTEFRIILPNGTTSILKAYALVQHNSQGQAQRMIGINYDITKRRQEELENQHLKERLQFVLSASPAVIYTCQASGNFDATFISDNVQNVLGYTAEECLREPNFWLNHIHPEDISQILADLSDIEDKEYYPYQYRFRHKDGNYLWIEDEYRLVRDQAGQAVEIIGYFVDISEQQAAFRERELAEAEIIRSRDLREAIFHESADALFLVDRETVKTIDCNQRAVELFAATNKTDLIGIEGHELQKEQFTAEDIQAIMDEMSTQGFWSREIEYKTFNGESFWGNLAAKEITVADQKMNLVRVTDISQRKLAEAQLQETNKQLAAFNEELARATRLKDEFLANMSHELRTPLNAILGLSEGLQDEVFGVINEKQRQSLRTIEGSGKHLLELINDILDLSKIEAGQMELHCIPTAISPLCQSSLAFIRQQALQKRIQLEVKIQPNLPELSLDERRIRQVLINLLNNAVKFTPEGGRITLEVTRQQIAPAAEMTSFQDFIRIAVIDTGIGIAPENLNKLFQPFIQIDSALNRQYTGTGLGLALVKRLVEIHGGKVEVSSELGVGSCFSVNLFYNNLSDVVPELVNQASSDLSSIFPETAQESPLILLAEDNEANIFTISNYLEATGYRLIVAKNGQEAIDLSKSQLPNLILMDVQMPEVDGLEAMRQIRLDSQLVNIPIIALTALAMPGDQEKCLAAGANDYLTKPVRLKQLASIIKQFLLC